MSNRVPIQNRADAAQRHVDELGATAELVGNLVQGFLEEVGGEELRRLLGRGGERRFGRLQVAAQEGGAHPSLPEGGPASQPLEGLRLALDKAALGHVEATDL